MPAQGPSLPHAHVHSSVARLAACLLALGSVPGSATDTRVEQVKPAYSAQLLDRPSGIYPDPESAFTAHQAWDAEKSGNGWEYEASNLHPCTNASQSFKWGVPSQWCHDYRVWYHGVLEREGETGGISYNATCPSGEGEWWTAENRNRAPEAIPGTRSAALKVSTAMSDGASVVGDSLSASCWSPSRDADS